MTTDSQLLKDQPLRTDHGFRQLAEQHHILDTRLDQLSSQHILSEPEQLERITLKKRKLRLKDRMQHILRRHVAPATA